MDFAASLCAKLTTITGMTQPDGGSVMAMGTRDFAQHPTVGHIISNRYYKLLQIITNVMFKILKMGLLPTPGKCLRVG
jgi:hypothetical protein